MHNLTLNVNDEVYNHLMNFLSQVKDDIKIVKDEIIKEEDIKDIQLFEESKKDKSDIKSIDDMLKEYKIES